MDDLHNLVLGRDLPWFDFAGGAVHLNCLTANQ
jgi:hypothetical protein